VLQAEFAGLLERLAGPAALTAVEVVDIEGHPELERRYGQRVPVLLADGEFVCAWRLDEARVRRVLESPG